MNMQEQQRRARATRTAMAAATLAWLCAGAAAQQQVVKPPMAQAWIDVATFNGMGMPMGGMAGGATNPMAALGGLFGGGSGAKNSFGNTQTMSAGRWVDVTLYTRNNPQLSEALQSVPPGFLSPALKLQAPRETQGSAPEPGDDRTEEPRYERPQGRLSLYWGCGDSVRAGQPKVLDMASASAADLARFFQSRSATQRGTHAALGRPVWPSPADARMVPPGASLVGEHGFTGQGVPESFRFQVPAAQDLMPAIELKQRDANGATVLEWAALSTARGQFIAVMGARGQNDMVLWTSSEQPDTGFGLMDYQTNGAVDRWVKEKVLLAPGVTACTVPAGVFTGQGAMLRMIAYGSELNLAWPPRPTDPKQAWEPQWATKWRVKSMTSAMLGMDMPARGQRPGQAPAEESPPPEDRKPGVKDLLKGILGR